MVLRRLRIQSWLFFICFFRCWNLAQSTGNVKLVFASRKEMSVRVRKGGFMLIYFYARILSQCRTWNFGTIYIYIYIYVYIHIWYIYIYIYIVRPVVNGRARVAPWRQRVATEASSRAQILALDREPSLLMTPPGPYKAIRLFRAIEPQA